MVEHQLNTLRDKLNELTEFSSKQCVLIHDLIDLISTNAFVAATVKDRIISSSTAGSAIQQPTPARVDVQHTKPTNTITTHVQGQDETSSVSILDFMTPNKMSAVASTPREEVVPPTAHVETSINDTSAPDDHNEDVDVSALLASMRPF